MEATSCVFYVCAVLIFLLLVAFFARSDADLTLRFMEKFGTRTDTLRNKVVWITGASSGIGEHLAYKLAEAGCRLVLSARREAELQRVKEKCLNRGPITADDIFVLRLDMLEYATHHFAVRQVLNKFRRIDILVNNAGRSQRAIWSRTPLEAPAVPSCIGNGGLLMRSIVLRLPHFLEKRSGHFVVTSSLAGKTGAAGLGSYSGTKHALHGWFESLRQEEYYSNIHVTMVCPGPVYSNAAVEAFTDKTGEKLGLWSKPGENRLATDRCAELMAVSIANKLDEVWISLHPELFFIYIIQYMPTIARKLAMRWGKRRKEQILLGKADLHGNN